MRQPDDWNEDHQGLELVAYSLESILGGVPYGTPTNTRFLAVGRPDISFHSVEIPNLFFMLEDTWAPSEWEDLSVHDCGGPIP